MKLLDASDDRQAVEILARAFDGDPLMRWISPRPGFLRTLFEFAVPLYRERGIACMTNQRDGVALWMKPGESFKFPFSIGVLSKFLVAGGVGSLIRNDRLNMSVDPYRPARDHYYLYVLGVDPGGRARGTGSSLVDHVLRRCDEEAVPAFLENTRKENLRFYRRHGFEVTREVRLGERGPTLWLMVREPAGGGPIAVGAS